MIHFIKNVYEKYQRYYAKRNSKRFTAWLRKQGCTVGEKVHFHGLKDISIDTTRPSLIEIGHDVVLTRGVTILTHGYDWFVLRNLYDEILCSSGKVKIGNNVFIGIHSTIMKGVTIGDNCIIGARSVVTRDIPDNSVAFGAPAKVLCSIETYYQDREKKYIKEALMYAASITDNLQRRPHISDFWEEFPLFLKKEDLNKHPRFIKQLGSAKNNYFENHSPMFDSFDEFIEAAKEYNT